MKKSKFVKAFSCLMIGSMLSVSGVALLNDIEKDNFFTIKEQSKVAKKVTITLESDKVTFANGKSSVEKDAGTKLTVQDFVTGNLPDGRTLLGLIPKDSAGNLGQCITFSEFVIPEVNTTYVPYFSSKAGYTSLWLYNSGSSKVNGDEVPGGLAYSKGFHATSSRLINGKGYGERGSITTVKAPIAEHDALRYDIGANGIISSSATYEFNYVFENMGTTAIHLDGYNISGSSEYRASGNYYNYEPRYRMDIDLQPGEVKEFTAQYSLGQNGNALVYLVADKDMLSGMNLGMALSIKKVGTAAPTTVSKPEVVDATVEFKLPKGMSLDASYKGALVGKDNTLFVAPTASQIKDVEGSVVTSWVNAKTGQPLAPKARLAADGLIVEPIISKNATSTNYALGKAKIDYYSTVTPDYKYKDDASSAVIQRANIVAFNKPGSKFYSNEAVKENAAIRLQSNNGSNWISTGKNYIFTHTLRNNSNEEVKFELYDVAGSSDFAGNHAASGVITLKPGEVKTIRMFYASKKNNSNQLTFFIVRKAVKNLDLDIVTNYVNTKDDYTKFVTTQDLGVKYHYVKDAEKATTTIDKLENANAFIELNVSKEMNALKNVTEKGILFTTDTSFVLPAFKGASNYTLSKVTKVQDKWTLKISFNDIKKQGNVEFLVAPYFVVDGTYFVGNSTITSLSKIASEKAKDASLNELDKLALEALIKEAK